MVEIPNIINYETVSSAVLLPKRKLGGTNGL